MKKRFSLIFILGFIFIISFGDRTAYAASNDGGNGKTDIIEESRQQREKLRESINKARAILDSPSSSDSGELRDSTEVIRHSNGAAPSSYRPHGQRDNHSYDTSKIRYNSNNTSDAGSSADYVVAQNQSPDFNALDTVGNTSSVDSNPSEQASGTNGGTTTAPASSTQASATPVSSTAPITESSNPEMSEKVRAVYNLIPEPIRKDYEDNGWVIKIVPQDTIRSVDPWMAQMPTIFGILAGLTDTGSKTIYLDDKYGDDAMAHEMGHYVDIVLLGSDDVPPSCSDEFRSLYDAEKEGFNSSYPKSDAHEYFAETFSLYVEYAGSMQKDFPRTYEYMDRIISPYGGTSTKGKTMTKEEEDNRYGIDFAEVFNFDDAYTGYISELQQMIEKGLNSPATKRAVDAIGKGGKNLLDTLISGVKRAGRQLNK